VLFIIEDMTGAGKTEAAVIIAHRMLQKGKADGLHVALPTMATANAMFERLASSYRRLFLEADTPSIVLTHGRRDLFAGFNVSCVSNTRATFGRLMPKVNPPRALIPVHRGLAWKPL
jgi:CRISPR-associated endonuclease/helicase Cas3